MIRLNRRLSIHTSYIAAKKAIRRLLREGGMDKHDITCLVVGLGNYGKERTRHSAGRLVVDSLAASLDLEWERRREILGHVAELTTDDKRLLLLKPRLYMNENGKSVAKAVKHFGVLPDDVFLVHDDLELPLGKCDIKMGGSARGHNGVRSTMTHLQSDKMGRLRFGIGRPILKQHVTSYVLSEFDDTELSLVQATVQTSVELLIMKFAHFIPQLKDSIHDDEHRTEQK